MKKSRKPKSAKFKKPIETKVVMYNVGFGDCFLLAFVYSEKKSVNILIDCGSTTKKKEHMSKVVDAIYQDCGGKLDALVVTHRHEDHLSAFGLKGVGDKLEGLNPDIVIQPWTEHPDAERGDLRAPTVYTKNAVEFLRTVESAEKFARFVAESPDKLMAAASRNTKRQLERIAKLNIKNKKAVTRLAKMGKKKRAYVYAGSRCGLEKLLPGVEVLVLGPPTLKQSDAIVRQTYWDDDEFWKLRNMLAAKTMSGKTTLKRESHLFHRAETQTIASAPSYTKWMIKHLDAKQTDNVRRIVRVLDNALNNTSVVLLFKVGSTALLFSGDAQLENWQYALADSNMRRALRRVALYKVGHHGSTNATPKSLWALFSKKRAKKSLVTLLSTTSGHHSKVPRKSLVDALEEETKLHTTQKLGRKLREEVVIRTR